MNKLAVFDLEIARPLSGGDDWLAQKPGISCAAVVLSDTDEVLVWHGLPEMGERGADFIVSALWRLRSQGYTLAGFNSAGFDFPMLVTEGTNTIPSEVCRGMAPNHYDLFFQIFATLGYSPGLDRIAKGLGLPGKPVDMDGSKAPELWQAGQYQTVLDYLVQDVRTTLDVFRKIEQLGGIQWTAKSGRPNTLDIGRFLTVSESMALPEPDTSWMDSPWSRDKFIGWLTHPPHRGGRGVE